MGRQLTVKSGDDFRAIVGILLCAAGLWLALPAPYREGTFLIDAGGCRLETTIVEKQEKGSQGSVLLFHGISANKKIMSYFARGLAEQGLRVYVPDLPGHGRTPGPFSPARAELCGESLLRELLTHGLINADRTILAGHSMGGAIAERIASRIPVAGLIAISPAPMRAAHGVTAEKLLFTDPPDLPFHSLVIVGSLELESMRRNAADLVVSRSDATALYMEIPGTSHVSVLFSGVAMRSAQGWLAHVLHLPPSAALPSHRPLIGALGGFLGILLIAGPFLRESAGKNRSEEIAATGAVIGVPRFFLEIAAGSVLIVFLLRFWIPLKRIGLFQGGFAGCGALELPLSCSQQFPSPPARGGICRSRGSPSLYSLVRLDVLRGLADRRKMGALSLLGDRSTPLPHSGRNAARPHRARKEMAQVGARFVFKTYLVGSAYDRRIDFAQRRNPDGAPVAVYGGVQFTTAERHGHVAQ
ncbi:MAG: hypothetical protein DMG49_16945 [Acidobacteria bacterium]|nr:MAG: hypothetical protein DMG49_16945 [Acidobacteriota bacterium]